MQEFKFKINGADYKCAVEEIEGGLTEVTVNGKKYLVETEKPAAPAPAPKPAAAPAAPKAAPAGGQSVNAPMPGTILAVNVKAGQAVKKGDVLIMLEAMKMENEIMAPVDGTVSAVNVTKGQSVQSGDVLVTLA